MEGPLGMTKVAHDSVASPRSEVEALARRLLALRSDIDKILVGLAQTPALPAPAGSAAEPVIEIPPAPDDLTLIRTIDTALAASLNSLGIVAFAQIAGWSRPDVMRASQALGLGRRISKENWIEQAAMLASGRVTAFARGHSEGASRSIWEAGHAPARMDDFEVLAREHDAEACTPAPVADECCDGDDLQPGPRRGEGAAGIRGAQDSGSAGAQSCPL